MGQQRQLARSLTSRPLQASKLIGIVLGLLLGVGGFLRVISADAVVEDPLLADGQFLALVFVPLIGIALVGIVLVETAVTGYRVLRSKNSIWAHAADRVGYVTVRAIEAGVAVVGLLVIAAMAPVLFAETTPAPVGVGLMLSLVGVGVAILIASLIRSVAEIYWVNGSR